MPEHETERGWLRYVPIGKVGLNQYRLKLMFRWETFFPTVS